jgi:hypothetical protein
MEKDFLGVGIPKDLNSNNGKWLAYEDAIKESMKAILLTRRGERVMRPDFGCGINDMVFNAIDSYTLNIIKENIKQALTRWEPRIRNIEMQINVQDSTLEINISYIVIETNNSDNLVFPFYPEGRWS